MLKSENLDSSCPNVVDNDETGFINGENGSEGPLIVFPI
jgi:hypothetical protein